MAEDKNNNEANADSSEEAAGLEKRERRDSSLYRDLKPRQAQSDQPADIEQTLKHAAERINQLTAELDAQSGQGGNTPKRWEESRTRYVLKSKNPDVVPVEHQAVIEELNSNLEQIETVRLTLEAQLEQENSGNKLEIAQIKGRLAELTRRKQEIENILNSGAAK